MESQPMEGGERLSKGSRMRRAGRATGDRNLNRLVRLKIVDATRREQAGRRGIAAENLKKHGDGGWDELHAVDRVRGDTSLQRKSTPGARLLQKM